MQEKLVYERLNHCFFRASKFSILPLGSGKYWGFNGEIFHILFQNIQNYIEILPFLAHNITDLTFNIIQPNEYNDFAMRTKYLWRLETNITKRKPPH